VLFVHEQQVPKSTPFAGAWRAHFIQTLAQIVHPPKKSLRFLRIRVPAAVFSGIPVTAKQAM
jgi:hypothetical protein